MRKPKSAFLKLFFCLTAAVTVFLTVPVDAKADEPFVIVIDPGHGGENLGAEYENYTEKDINMPMAVAMKEELEKYDNVVVYLTHEEDVDMSIKERAEFAAGKNADFLFCLHFNASVKHNLYGAEVWVPSLGEYYAKGYAYAEIMMAQFEEMGFYSRGIKTRLLDSGKEDYYGILRYCTEEEVPAVLIEHCHLDNETDLTLFEEKELKERLAELGRADAVAVAKYFRLTSSETGADYSNYQVSDIPVPDGRVAPDKTEPEVAEIEITEVDKQTGEVTVSMTASDDDSYILYCDYSIDGGETYSPLLTWPRPVWNQSEKENTFTFTVPFDQDIQLVARAYNGFDVWTKSNREFITAIPDPAVEKARAEEAELLRKQREYEEISIKDQAKSVKASVWPVIVSIAAIVVCMLVVILFLTKNIFRLLDSSSRP